MPPSPCSAAATASWSLNGRRPVADDLAAFVALAGDQQHIAAAAAPRPRGGSPRGGRRSRPRPGAAARIAARIVAGSSLRGLSSVTITLSAFCAAIAPISGRLPASRSPPAPNTTIRLALHIGPQRLERLRQRVGLVRVVDEDRRAVALADQIEPALRALQRSQRSKHRAGLAAGRDRKAGRDQRILDLERADQRQPQRIASCRRARASAAGRSRRSRSRSAGCRRPCGRP